MDKQDKKLLQESTMVVLDNAVAAVDTYWQTKTGLVLQPFSTTWGLMKVLYGSVLERRAKKTSEIIAMVDENKEVFTQEAFSDEKFQDGFIYVVGQYLIERNEDKRKIARSILLGFAQALDKEIFPLEKFIHTLGQLSETDIQVLRDVKVEEKGQNYQVYGDNARNIDNIYSLISHGLLLNTTGSRTIFNAANSPFVKVSGFGESFLKYLKA